MKTTAITAAGLSLLLASTAFAQTPATSTAQTPPTQNTTNQKPVTAAMGNIRNDLTKAGYTNVQVMPESVMVRAKDSSGNPVVMFISPDSFAELTSAPKDQPATGRSAFRSVSAQDKLTSQVVGLDIYNNANQDIGTIKDVAMNNGRLQAYIVSVGGFLGMGEHYVAVSPDTVNISFDHAKNKWAAKMDATADTLKGAPEFKYADHTPSKT